MTANSDNPDFKGKVVVVTGGGSGINLAIAKQFAEHGAVLALIGRSAERLDAAVVEIEGAGGRATGHPADVRDYERLAGVMSEIREKSGQISVLVCGAAGNFPAAASVMSANGFKAVVDIDLLGTFNAARAAYSHLQKPGASIITISAVQATVPMPMQAHVCAAKAGVEMLTKCLALEWGREGVRVNAIAPGPIAETEGMKRLAPTPKLEALVSRGIPLGKFGSKSDIAEAAIYLASSAAAFVTGSILVCDGGQSLGASGLDLMALLPS